MLNDLTNVKSALRRHTTPGALAIYMIAIVLFLPRLWDLAVGEPWVGNTISILKTSDGSYLIEDTITTRSSIYGDRMITVERPPEKGELNGVVLCSSRWSGAWEATTRRNWAMSALAGNCQPGSGVFRVCSRFSLYSASGRHRTFPPFCSEDTSFTTEPQVKKVE